jgi:hypothetical protein
MPPGIGQDQVSLLRARGRKWSEFLNGKRIKAGNIDECFLKI